MRKELVVDVVLKTYNSRRWIGEAVDSVLRQTYPHWHLTVVDDASSDGTTDFLQERYRKHASRITLIALGENRGPTGAQLEGIRSGSRDAFALVDADDAWHPRKLELQVRKLQREPSVHAVHTDVRRIDEWGKVLESATALENQRRANIPFDRLASRKLALALFPGHVICNGSALILRSAYERAGGYDEALSGAADFEFWVRFAASGHRIAHLPLQLYDRRVHQSRFTTRNRLALTEKRVAAVDKLVGEYPFLGGLATARKEAFLRERLLWSLEDVDGAIARQTIRELARLDHLGPKLAAIWTVSWLGPLAKVLLRGYAFAARRAKTGRTGAGGLPPSTRKSSPL
jgi:glycosyltransferase involved in cell wall biosynthesis